MSSSAILKLACAGLCFMYSIPAGAQPTITAREVVERIRQRVGVPWSEETVDTFKAGDPDAEVTGVAVTMMATYDVLRRAAGSGLNMIITHEPTYYGHFDEKAALAAANDPVFRAKESLIEEHGLIVWRFHDHWHRRSPDGVQEGMVQALGWESYRRDSNDFVFQVPETSLTELATFVRDRLGIRTMRLVGDPKLMVTKVALIPGFPGFEMQRSVLARGDVEVLVMGEAHEWETILYGADAVSAGLNKALIVMGHIPSEQEGMRNAADWLRSFVTEVTVEFVPAAEPFSAIGE